MTLNKKEAIEGGNVMVTCSVPEEKAPVHFTVEKFELSNVKAVRQKKEKTSQNQNFVMLEFTVEEQDRVIVFYCQAAIISGKNVETSTRARSELVTVRGQFCFAFFHFFRLAGSVWGERAQDWKGAGGFRLGCCSQDHFQSL